MYSLTKAYKIGYRYLNAHRSQADQGNKSTGLGVRNRELLQFEERRPFYEREKKRNNHFLAILESGSPRSRQLFIAQGNYVLHFLDLLVFKENLRI